METRLLKWIMPQSQATTRREGVWGCEWRGAWSFLINTHA